VLYFLPSLLNLGVDELEETERAPSTFVDTSRWRGVQATHARTGLLSGETKPGWRNEPTGTSSSSTRTKCNILHLGGTDLPALRQSED